MNSVEGDAIDNPIDLTRPPIMLRIPNPWSPQYLPSPPASPSPSPEIRHKICLHLKPPKPHQDHTRQEFLMTDGARDEMIRRARLEGRREARRELGLDEDMELAEDTVVPPGLTLTRAACKDTHEVMRDVKEEPSC